MQNQWREEDFDLEAIYIAIILLERIGPYPLYTPLTTSEKRRLFRQKKTDLDSEKPSKLESRIALNRVIETGYDLSSDLRIHAHQLCVLAYMYSEMKLLHKVIFTLNNLLPLDQDGDEIIEDHDGYYQELDREYDIRFDTEGKIYYGVYIDGQLVGTCKELGDELTPIEVFPEEITQDQTVTQSTEDPTLEVVDNDPAPSIRRAVDIIPAFMDAYLADKQARGMLWDDPLPEHQEDRKVELEVVDNDPAPSIRRAVDIIPAFMDAYLADKQARGMLWDDPLPEHQEDRKVEDLSSQDNEVSDDPSVENLHDVCDPCTVELELTTAA